MTEAILQDLRYAVRRLARSPGFTAVAVLTLGLGIGANSAIFSVVNGVLLRSLPFEEPDRLVQLYTAYPDDETRYPLSPPDFMSFHEEARSFSDVAAYAPTRRTITQSGDPAELNAALVSADFLQLLGTEPLIGRGFLPEENQPGQTNVVIISHALWQQRFGADPGVVGRTMVLNGIQHTVVGVLPSGSEFPSEREVYIPLQYNETFNATTADGRRGEYIDIIARLAPGVTLEQANAEVQALSNRLQQEFPETNTVQEISMIPLSQQLLGDVKTPLFILLGAVGLVLLIACANVANLLLARAAARESEFAVRSSLGAGRDRLIRQLLTESVVLGALGGLLGLLIAAWGTNALIALRPEGIPRIEGVGVDATVVAFTAIIALLTGIVFGLIPAIQMTRGDLTGALKEGGRGAMTGRAGNRLRGSLVVAEMALAVMLLVGSGLLIRSFLTLTAVEPGMRTERVLTFDLSLPSASYDTSADIFQFYGALLDRLEQLPAVTSVGASSELPLTGIGTVLSFLVEGREPPPRNQVQDAAVKFATPDFFRTLGIPLRSGRVFTEQDRAGAPQVALINEAAVRRYFPDGEAIGENLLIGDDQGWQVVGIVGDVPQSGLDQETRPEFYIPAAQAPRGRMTIAMRTSADPLALTGAIRAGVNAMDPNLPISEFTTVEEILSESVAQPRFYTMLLTLFAAVALILAAIGIFGVMSYAVAQRTREIGIRIALGAEESSVLMLVVSRALGLAAGGVALGLLGAFLLSRLLESLLFGVTATDLPTYSLVAVLLLGVAALASYLPARRATRVDPNVALRAE